MVGPKIQLPVMIMIPYPIQRISWTPDTARDKKEELLRLLDMESLELFALAGPVTALKGSWYYMDAEEKMDELYWGSLFFDAGDDQDVNCKKNEDGVWCLQFIEVIEEGDGQYVAIDTVEVAVESIPLSIRDMLFFLQSQDEDDRYDGYCLFMKWFKSATGFEIYRDKVDDLIHILGAVALCREKPPSINGEVAREMLCREMLLSTPRSQRGILGKLPDELMTDILDRIG